MMDDEPILCVQEHRKSRNLKPVPIAFLANERAVWLLAKGKVLRANSLPASWTTVGRTFELSNCYDFFSQVLDWMKV